MVQTSRLVVQALIDRGLLAVLVKDVLERTSFGPNEFESCLKSCLHMLASLCEYEYESPIQQILDAGALPLIMQQLECRNVWSPAIHKVSISCLASLVKASTSLDDDVRFHWQMSFRASIAAFRSLVRRLIS